MLRARLHTKGISIEIEGSVDDIADLIIKVSGKSENTQNNFQENANSTFISDQAEHRIVNPYNYTVISADSERLIDPRDILAAFYEIGRPANARQIYDHMVSRGTLQPNRRNDTSHLRNIMRNDPQQRFVKTSTKMNALWMPSEWSIDRDSYLTNTIFDASARSSTQDVYSLDESESNN